MYIWRSAAMWGLLTVVACGGQIGPGTETAGLTIAANSTTSFDATYRLGSDWARAHVEYTPSTTMYEITTASGAVIVRTGTALSAASGAPVPADSRRVDEVVRLSPDDPEYAVVSGLLDALLASGATPRPTALQAGSTLYGAAYFAAVALGQTPKHNGPTTFVRPSAWPYPGYVHRSDLPAELRVQIDGEQNGRGSMGCCGPYNCVDADWTNQTSCDDWCAAGDFCNTWGWGGCGTAMWWPSGGCNSCPHSDSSTVRSYSLDGCNNGSCGVSCWEPTPTHYGPASNFCYYGNYYFGAGGGEYGSGPDDGWSF
jgi:hypothetical protein